MEIIDASLEWTATVLFRPFEPKKWLILGFIALMAAYLAGYNLNLGNDYYSKEKGKQAEAKDVSHDSVSNLAPQEIKKQLSTDIARIFTRAFSDKILAFILIIGLIIVLIIIVIMMWLRCRFAFVFLENISKNDASIKAPFKANKEPGNSLFLFSLIFTVIFLTLFFMLIFMCLWALIKIGTFQNPAGVGFKKIFLASLPYGLALLLLIFISLIISVITNEFVLVVMFKDRVKIMQAWLKTLGILSANIADLVKYFFVIMGLGICSGIICWLLGLVATIGLILPVGIIAGVSYLIYLPIPVTSRLLYFIVLFIILTPPALFLLYCLTVYINLPFAVFFRTFSLKFIGRLDRRYNLFKLMTNEEVAL